MTLRCVWFVSVENKKIIYSRNFVVNEYKARKRGFPALPEKVNDNEFISSLFSVLGLCSSRVANDEFDEESSGNSESEVIHFDCTLVNQLPVVELKINQTPLWPLVVIENNGILFCGLALVNSSSKEIIDHISISLVYSSIQSLINHFARSGSLSSMEEFITECMPFGTLLRNSDKPKSEISSVASSKPVENVVSIRVIERISSGARDKEILHGTVTVQNTTKMNEEASIFLNIKNLDDISVVLSPHCYKITDSKTLGIKLSQRVPKIIHYKCSGDTISNLPFLVYNYSVCRSQSNNYKMNLSLDFRKFASLKFSYFSIVFKNGFSDGSAKVIDSTLNWGQLQLERNNGVVWLIGSKLPKTGKVNLTCDVTTTKDSCNFADAIANFKVDNFCLGFEKLSADSISNNEHVLTNYKLLFDYSFSSYNYKIIPNFE